MGEGTVSDRKVFFDVIMYKLSSATSRMFHGPTMPLEQHGRTGGNAEDTGVEPFGSNVIELPARSLDAIWESLTFSPPIHEDLLTSLTTYGTSLYLERTAPR